MNVAFTYKDKETKYGKDVCAIRQLASQLIRILSTNKNILELRKTQSVSTERRFLDPHRFFSCQTLHLSVFRFG